MRIVPYISTYPSYIDRSGTNVVQSYAVWGVPPHSSSIRFTYQVPAGRKAIVDYGYMRISRSIAATLPSRPTMILQFCPAAGSYVPLCYLTMPGNDVYDPQFIFLPVPIFLAEGDCLRLYTSDDSTGGTCDYNATFKIFEFV